MATTAGSARADVELRLPADGAYASVLRTTAAGLAARLDFTIDDIEDLRMAAGEAHAMVLAEADDTADLTCEFFLGQGSLTLRMSVPATNPGQPDYESFGWQVLSTLAAEVAAEASPERFTVTLTTVSDLLAATDPPAST